MQIVRLGLYRGPEIQLGVLIVLVLERGKTASAVENNCHLLFQLLKISVGHSSRFLVRFERVQPFGAVGLQICEVLLRILPSGNPLPSQKTEQG